MTLLLRLPGPSRISACGAKPARHTMRGNGNLIQTFSQSLSDLPPLLPVSLPHTPSLAITTSSTSTTARCQKPLRDVEQRAAMNLPLDAIFPPTTINNVNIKAHNNMSFRYSSSNIAHCSLIFQGDSYIISQFSTAYMVKKHHILCDLLHTTVHKDMLLFVALLVVLLF